MSSTEIFLTADYADNTDCFLDLRHPRNPRLERIQRRVKTDGV
jgi:hypothetical protein